MKKLKLGMVGGGGGGDGGGGVGDDEWRNGRR